MRTENILAAFGMILRYGSKAILIVILGKLLSPNELAAWYVLLSLIGVFLIAEGGLRQISIRGISYRLANYGRDEAEAFKISIIFAYAVVALISVSLALTFGYSILRENKSTTAQESINVVWAMFVAGSIGSLGISLVSSVFMGMGNVKQAQLAEMTINLLSIISLLIYLTGLNASANLVTISYSVNLPIIVGLVLYLFYFTRCRGVRWSVCARYSQNILKRHAQEIFPSYLYLMLNVISYNILTSLVILHISDSASPDKLASYGLSQQILGMVMAFSSIPIVNSFNRISEKSENSRRTAAAAIRYGWFILIASVASVNLFGKEFLNLLGFRSNILEIGTLALFSLTLIVEYVATLYGQALTANALEKIYSLFNLLFSTLFLALLYVLPIYSGNDFVWMLTVRLVLAITVFCMPMYFAVVKNRVI